MKVTQPEFFMCSTVVWYCCVLSKVVKEFLFFSHDLPICAKSLQSCPTLYDPMDYSPPGSSVHGRQEY